MKRIVPIWYYYNNNMKNKKLIEIYDYYVNNISSPGMAASFQTCAYLLSLCEKYRPKVIIDLGSGISSYFFSVYAQKVGGVSVYSYDDNKKWLNTSKNFVGTSLVYDHKFIFWSDDAWFPKSSNLMFYDLGNMYTRVSNLGKIYNYFKKQDDNSVLILDDMHKVKYRSKVESIIPTKKITYLTDYTLDKKNRYSALVCL